jgi:hypothetical protein
VDVGWTLVVARSEGDTTGQQQAIEGHRATIKAYPTSTLPPSPLRNPGPASCADPLWSPSGGCSSFPTESPENLIESLVTALQFLGSDGYRSFFAIRASPCSSEIGEGKGSL